MIYATPSSVALAEPLAELDELRARLGEQAGNAGPWLGDLRRRWRAESAESSIEIEGFRVPESERVAVAAGTSAGPRDDDRLALSCYALAMDHVGVMAGDPHFRWVDRVILDLHFEACSFQRGRDPGRYRSHGIEVTSPVGGPPAYVGPPWESVPGLMGEIIAWLGQGDLDAHVAVRAAMAHLHVVSVHPFRDGNGRISRITQSLVLAREGPLAPEFVSIEEHLGGNTAAYYAVLQEVQGGRYQPERDAAPWVRFCVDAHIVQARRRLEQIVHAGRRWAVLEGLVAERGWPDRLAVAMELALSARVDRSAYATEAGVSDATASNDLRRLADAGLVVRDGKGRTTGYRASDALRRAVAEAPGSAG